MSKLTLAVSITFLPGTLVYVTIIPYPDTLSVRLWILTIKDFTVVFANLIPYIFDIVKRP